MSAIAARQSLRAESGSLAPLRSWTVTRLFVSDERAAAPLLAAPDRGCALPVREAEMAS
jgi:hypothetical protein